MSTLPRNISKRIDEALKQSPVVFLNGPRQAGKSTLVRSMAEDATLFVPPASYHTFDRPTEMAAASSAPEAFLTAYKGSMIIDEVQLVPQLFRALKTVVDEWRLKDRDHVNGKYLLTGSANIMALPKLSESLVGRMSVLTLYPFSASEAIMANGRFLDRLYSMDFVELADPGYTLIQIMKLATFPEITNKTNEVVGNWFDGYITTILQRDVRQLAELDKINLLPALLKILATRAGGLINDAEIARSLGMNSVTGKSYRNILKMMFLHFEIQPWYSNIGKRLVKAPKGYIIETLMLCYLLGQHLEDIHLHNPVVFGHVAENFVATELLKQLAFHASKAQLFHFRTSDGKEVDFIIERPDGTIFAVEVKASENVNADDFATIKLLSTLSPKQFVGGIVIYSGKQAVPFGKNLWAVPFHSLWAS